MAQSVDLTQAASRMHWSARVSFFLPLSVVLLLLLYFVLPNAPQWFHFVPGEGWSFFIYTVLASLFRFGLFLVPIPALILSGFALFIARRPAWRRGLAFAIPGGILSLLLCGELALYIYFLCCFKFQLHFVF